MSKSISSSRSHIPSHAQSADIHYYDDHVAIHIPIADWNEGLAKKAKSVNIATDSASLAASKTGEADRRTRDQNTATAAHSASPPNPSDEIPVTYFSGTRRIISLAGFILSSSAILAIHAQGNVGHVPGFKPLLLPSTTDLLSEGFLTNCAAIAIVGIVGMVSLFSYVCRDECKQR